MATSSEIIPMESITLPAVQGFTEKILEKQKVLVLGIEPKPGYWKYLILP